VRPSVLTREMQPGDGKGSAASSGSWVVLCVLCCLIQACSFKVLPFHWGLQSDHCIHVPCTFVHACLEPYLLVTLDSCLVGQRVCSSVLNSSSCDLLQGWCWSLHAFKAAL
jgi:hypothetical protein